MTPRPQSCGFVYVATGPKYVAEACASAATLRTAMPSAQIALITDFSPGPEAARLFSHVTLRPDAERRPIDKLLAWYAPFDRCVFLDTDTLIAGDITDLFDLLDSFDLAATVETLRGLHYTLPDVPASFSEYNTGVVVFRRTPEVAAFFKTWREDYDRLHASHGFVSDQPAFRWAAFRSQIRIAPVPSEYHFITTTPNYVMWQARLLHGRNNLPGLAQEINSHLGARVYVPRLGIIHPFQGRRTWLQQLIRLGVHALRMAIYTTHRELMLEHWTKEEKTLTAERARAKSAGPAS